MKFAIIGTTGQTGSIVAQTLAQNGHTVRAIVRNQAAAEKAANQGYETFIAPVDDVAALTAAFTGVDGAYLMNPPAYMEADMFARAHTVHKALLQAAKAANLPHAVALSSVGGQHATGTGNILTTYDFEQQIAQSGLNISIVRAANFLDNWASSFSAAREQGILPSMFLPLDKKYPMVSSIDIGRTVTQILMQGNSAPQLTELKGPEDCSAHDVAQVLSALLERDIKAVEVNPDQIAPFFSSKGFPVFTAQAFSEMMNGFNANHIVFTGQGQSVVGNIGIEAAFKHILDNDTDTHG
jgi:uncharacterized protein YbjT (DUF2867 family)